MVHFEMDFVRILRRAPTVALAFTSLALAAWGGPALACSVCACGDPLLAASDPAAINGRLRLQLDTEYLRVDAGTDGRPGYTDQLAQWSYRFNAVYKPIERLSLTATVPIVSKAMHTVGGGTRSAMSDLTGLGDVEVAARATVWRSVSLGVGRVHEVALSAGTSLPTGKKDAKVDDGSGMLMLVDPHGQIGSGAWGPFVGAHYLVEQDRWLGFASLSGRLRTEASYFDGSRYKFGDVLQWSVHGQFRPVGRVALDLGVDGRYARADRATAPDGTIEDRVVNTGGTLLSAAPAVYFNARGGLWVFVRAQVPVYKHLFGEQDVLPSFATGLQLQVL